MPLYSVCFSDEKSSSQSEMMNSPDVLRAALTRLRHHFYEENGYEWMTGDTSKHRIIVSEAMGVLVSFKFQVKMLPSSRFLVELSDYRGASLLIIWPKLKNISIQ